MPFQIHFRFVQHHQLKSAYKARESQLKVIIINKWAMAPSCCIEKAHTLVTALEINGVSVYRTTSEVAGVQDYDQHSSLLIPALTHPCKRLKNIVGKDGNLKHKQYLYRLRSSGNTNSEEPAPPTWTPKSEGEAATFGERRSKSRSCLQHFL